MRRAAVLLVLAGCPNPGSVSNSDVLSLTVCGGASPCTARADGRSTTPVRVCARGAAPHPAGLSVALVLSHGTWENPPDAAKPQLLTAPLPTAPADDGSLGTCIEASVVSATDMSPIFIDATLAGYAARGCIQMRGPHVELVVVTSTPTVLDGGQTSITVTAAPLGEPGTMPPAATVDFTAVPTPASAPFSLQPQHTRVDATGKATAQLIASAGMTDVKVTATASVPDGPACDPEIPTGGAGSGSSGAIDIPLLPDASIDAPPDAPLDGLPDASPDAA